jgi:hypothetical protein
MQITASIKGSKVTGLVAAIFVIGLFVLASTQPAQAIPAFARKYGLPCSACHEAWPKLNSFGQNFKDNGFQLMNDRDSPIWQNPSYWPVSMRITPFWHYESMGNQTVDVVPGGNPPGTVEETVNTSGFDLTGIDILAGGTLSKNISFLLVPSIDAGSGTVGFESANVRFDNILGSPWFNFKFGKFELDPPLSEKRIMTLSDTGGFYQLYHFIPYGNDTNDATMGENQLGVELMGHSKNDHTRLIGALVNSSNGNLGLNNSNPDLGVPAGRTYDGYIHVSQGFMAGHLGLQRVGAYAFVGLRPTYSLTSEGVPIPGTGQGNRSFYRVGFYGSLYLGKFDFTGVYQKASDNVFLANGVAANTPDLLPVGSRGAGWNTGTFEAHYTYTPRLFFIGRYELVRMTQQPATFLPDGTTPRASDYGNTDTFTIGYRYYPFMNTRAGLAWHQEFATSRSKLTSDTGQDQRNNSYFMGFDFAF